MDLYKLYKSGKSITQVSDIIGLSKSTVRLRLKDAGILRSRADAVRLAAKNGRLGSGNRCKKRVFTKKWADNISKAKLGRGKGWSLKPNGYIAITMGENKGRSEHCVIAEDHIGRRLMANECIHHINGCRSDNRIENLQVMTRSDHMALHSKINIKLRARDSKGKLI